MRPGRRASVLALLLAVAVVVPAAGAGTFVVEENGFVVGQAPDWLDEKHVVWHRDIPPDEGGDGEIQVFSSTLDGASLRCLTCGLDGPNQVLA